MSTIHMVSVSSILIASAFSVASADLAGAMDAVASDASVLSSHVAKWSSGQGLGPALQIQSVFYPLATAVTSLNNVAGSASQSDVSNNAAKIVTLTTSVSNLLNALASKAADFEHVEAFTIAADDINGLTSPAAQIFSKLLAANKDTALAASLKGNVNGLADAISTAISAFKANSVSFPRIQV